MRMAIPLEQFVQEVESREEHRPALLGVLDAFMERLDESKERFTDQEYLGACELAKHAYSFVKYEPHSTIADLGSGEVLSPRSWRHIKRQIMYLIRGIMTVL